MSCWCEPLHLPISWWSAIKRAMNYCCCCCCCCRWQTSRQAPPSPCTPHTLCSNCCCRTRRGPATLCAVCVCGSFFGRLQQLPASKLSGKVCWLANNNGDMRLQCATNEGKQAARAARAAQTRRDAPALPADTQHCPGMCTQLPYASACTACTGTAACCRRWHKLAMLYAAVGNNSAANEINCAHTDNCMGGKQREGRGLG